MKYEKRTLYILMNGITVGQLDKTKDGGLAFTYEQSWLTQPGARPISLSLPLTSQPFIGDVVYNFFDNLLPDNTQIRARIQRRFHIASDQPFDLLASIGKDCVGAIQLIESTIPEFNKDIAFEQLDDNTITTILRSYREFPLGMVDSSDGFRISIAGAQEKSAFLLYKNKWCRPLGATPTSHIFKLPIGFIEHQQLDLSDSCENEWLCLQIAAEFGLPTANCEIQHFNDIKVLIVERFDRKFSSDGSWLMRLPQEDMCQALGVSPNLKYQSDGGPGIKQIMQLLLGATNPARDRDNFMRSQILFWMLAAIDGHAKNFSLHIEPEGKYRLTPLYDIISAYPMLAGKQLQRKKIKMAMALKGSSNHYHWQNIQRRHFLSMADEANYSVEKTNLLLHEMASKVDGAVERLSKRLPHNFPEHVAQPIFDGIVATKSLLAE